MRFIWLAPALEYFRQIETSGTPVIVTDHGQPKLEIRPYLAPTVSPLQKLKGTVLRYDKPTEPVAEDEWDTLQ